MPDETLIHQLRETAQACLALADRLANRLDPVEAPAEIVLPPKTQSVPEGGFLDGYPMQEPRC